MDGFVHVPPPQKVLCAASHEEKVAALMDPAGAGLCLAIFASSSVHLPIAAATSTLGASPAGSAATSGASPTSPGNAGLQWLQNLFFPLQPAALSPPAMTVSAGSAPPVAVSGSAVATSSLSSLASSKPSMPLIKRYSDLTIGQHEVDLDVRGNVSVGELQIMLMIGCLCLACC